MWTPRRTRAYLGAVPAGGLLLLDLHAEKRPFYPALGRVFGRSSAHAAHGFVFCVLHNFGGSHGMAGELGAARDGFDLALASTGGAGGPTAARGLGLSMEGIEQNGFLYEGVLDHAWALADSADANAAAADAFEPRAAAPWRRAWVRARYALGHGGAGGGSGRGVDADAAQRAWACLGPLLYARPARLAGWGPPKSVFERRPTSWARTKPAAGFQPTMTHYKAAKLLPCARALLAAARAPDAATDALQPAAALPEAFLYDVVDVVRQVVADHALEASATLEETWTRAATANGQGDAAAADAAAATFRALAARLERDCADTERLLATHRRWRASWMWLDHAGATWEWEGAGAGAGAAASPPPRST